MRPPETLFVFTKLFPFGNAEQYLADELPSLCAAFDKVVLVPCELFGDQFPARRSLPPNCDVLLLNQEASRVSTRRNWGEFWSVFTGEWMRCRSKTWFWKERKRYSSVLLHQAHLASVFETLLDGKYRNSRNTFYAYWIHNSSIMLGLLKRRRAINGFLSRGHSIDLYEWDWALTRYVKILPFYHFIIRHATRVVTISQHGKKYLEQRFPAMKEKFICSYLGVDDHGAGPFDPAARFTIVSCSNFSDNKRVDVIASVVAAMKTPVRWIHFGAGKGRENTEAVIRSFPPHVSAELRGFTPNEEIKAFYGAETVNLFINLSEAEGIPVSIMEAISFGIPALATAVYGNPEVANDSTGFSVPFATAPAEIAAIIDKFAVDPARQASVRASTREFYRQHFSAPANYAAFAAILRSLP